MEMKHANRVTKQLKSIGNQVKATQDFVLKASQPPSAAAETITHALIYYLVCFPALPQGGQRAFTSLHEDGSL